jgi:hypothetical protein
MGNKETAEREFAQALVKELQELHTRNYLREIGIVPTQVVFAALHTIKELLRQVAVLETEAALREPAPQPQAEPVGEWVMVPREPTHAMLKAGVEWGGEAMDYHEAMGRIGAAWGPMLAAAPQPQAEPVAPQVGDYVLGTKYNDGDPGDPWAVGIYAGMKGDRHVVTHRDGTPIYRAGFRRVGVITPEQGRYLLSVKTSIERGGKSVWDIVATPPRPQASAEDVELVGRYVTAHKSLKTDLHDAWQRIRASLGVGQ